jgi:cytidylate kinase
MPARALTRETGGRGWTTPRRRDDSRGATEMSGQMFAVDWRDSLLYDLVVDTETVDVGQVLGLMAGTSFVVAAGGHVRLAGMVGSNTAFRRPVQ